MSKNNHVGLWNACLDIIRDNVPEQTYKTWFCPIVPLKFEDDTLVLQVPSQFFYEFLEEKFLDLLRQTIHKVFGERTKLMYSVMVVKNPPTAVPLPTHSGSSTPVSAVRKTTTKDIPQTPQITELDPHLNRDYNFETFIEGESNKLSRSVAEAVALNPAKTIFNPLFFYGASGVGKTHLANAIGTKIKELYPEKRVLYVSAHLFQVQYTDSVRNNTTNDFINFYQTIDVLIIDDIQEFAGVTKTQNTFFHIFNHLHQNGKQLILTSDRAPVLLQGMEERLVTRFKWGMVAELEKPTVELRKDILRNKIRRDGLQFPPEVINYIQNCGAYRTGSINEWKKPGKADPVLIAIAKQYDYEIVTFEKESGQFGYDSNRKWNWKKNGGPSKHEPKIPDIAKHFGISCITLFDLEEKLGLSI